MAIWVTCPISLGPWILPVINTTNIADLGKLTLSNSRILFSIEQVPLFLFCIGPLKKKKKTLDVYFCAYV